MKLPKLFEFCILIAVLWLVVPLFNRRVPDRFSFDRVAVDFSGTVAIDEDVETARQILSSLAEDGKISLDYLGHGSQAAVFQGKDERYVLKLLLNRSIDGKKVRFASLRRIIPAFRREQDKKMSLKKEERFEKALGAYQLGLKYLKEETGLIAIHLHPTQNVFPKCSVKDRHGKSHEIDLDRAVFILQKKAEAIEDRFARLRTRAEYDAAVHAIDSLLESKIRKGITDFKERFKKENYGFVGTQAIFLDPGRSRFSEALKENPEPELERMKNNLRKCLR